MTRPAAPTHWAAGKLPDELATLLESAASDAPSASIERVRARLDAALGADFAPQTKTVKPQLATATRQLARGKWLGFGVILAVGAVVFLIARMEPHAAGATNAQQPPSAAEASSLASLNTLAPSALAASDASDASDREPELPSEPPRADELQPAAAEVPAADGPVRIAKRGLQRTAAPAGLAEELRQLKQIRQHVTFAPARALQEADAHGRRFPQGTLGPERELLRIDALLRLGRVAEAHELADRELAAPGGYPYRARIEKLFYEQSRGAAQ